MAPKPLLIIHRTLATNVPRCLRQRLCSPFSRSSGNQALLATFYHHYGPLPTHRYICASTTHLRFHPPHRSLFTTTTSAKMTSATSFYDFKPLDKRGQPYPLADLKDKVVLVVNTASKCGFTPQFGSLEALYKDIRDTETNGKDFVIVGFPCNQFGSQDPGSNDEIQEFCQLNYGVSFPVLGKIDVNGDHAEPVFEWLKGEKPGIMGLKRIKWNFEKFLVGRDGEVKGRWASTTKPETLKKDVLAELKKKTSKA